MFLHRRKAQNKIVSLILLNLLLLVLINFNFLMILMFANVN